MLIAACFMPLFYSQTIDEHTRLGIWKIEEDESFFLDKVPLIRSISHPHKRLQHLAGRFLLQYLFPDFPLMLIQVADTRKPFLPQESHHFSISHCGSFAAAIVSTEKRVGIDIEEPGQRILAIVPKFLSERERGLTLPHATDQLMLTATILWSAKEAMFKWYSLGEVDFRKHLQVEAIDFKNSESGSVLADFRKYGHQSLSLSFQLWPNLVLCWISV